MEEKVWALVGSGSPYTYVGKITAETAESVGEIVANKEAVDLFDARQIQTIVIPAGNNIGQENLVGPIALCATDAHMRIRPTWIILPDEKTIKIIEEKYNMAQRADIHDSAKRAGIDTEVDNVRSILNKDGLKGKP